MEIGIYLSWPWEPPVQPTPPSKTLRKENVEIFQLDMQHQHTWTQISDLQKATDMADIYVLFFLKR